MKLLDRVRGYDPDVATRRLEAALAETEASGEKLSKVVDQLVALIGELEASPEVKAARKRAERKLSE